MVLAAGGVISQLEGTARNAEVGKLRSEVVTAGVRRLRPVQLADRRGRERCARRSCHSRATGNADNQVVPLLGFKGQPRMAGAAPVAIPHVANPPRDSRCERCQETFHLQ